MFVFVITSLGDSSYRVMRTFCVQQCGCLHSAHEIPLGPCEIDSKVAKMMIDIIQYIYNYRVIRVCTQRIRNYVDEKMPQHCCRMY